ncbi:MAG: GntR family transcriptional regulator [Blautia sp.]|jgi:DNA-binding GntR family transcriptional regulator
MPKKSLKQHAYENIKNKILSCEYAPGAFLNEDILCEEFQVSRTPVRDALGRLEQENLVTIFPKKGFQVSPLTIAEINMVFEGRILLESYFIRSYCWNMPPEILDKMAENIENAYTMARDKNQAGFFELDNQFHDFFVQRCKNRYLLRSYNDMQSQNFRLRVLSGRLNEQRIRETADEHSQILQYLLQEDVNKAADAMRNHLLNAQKSAFGALANSDTPI